MEVITAYLIFFLIVFVIGGVVLLVYLIKYWFHVKEVAQVYISNNYVNTNVNVNRVAKALMKDNSLLQEAERMYKNQQERDHFYKETQRKEAIAQRVFAYDYEELLFQIYARIAEDNDHFGYWTTIDAREGYDESNLIHMISIVSKKSIPESEQLFNILLEHHLIYKWGGTYRLTTMLEKTLGDNLLRWDVVTDIDWNLDKWMNAHGYKHKNI